MMALLEARRLAQLEMVGLSGLTLLLSIDEDDEKNDTIQPVLHAVLVQRGAQVLAWQKFCEQVGVDPNCVADTLGPSAHVFCAYH